jgi:ergothioneine biosynthesis protein EgtB
MPDVSPTRWHLAHTTWFFETFLLGRQAGYRAFDPSYEYLFNSYYNTVGKQFPRPQRGLLSRPGLDETWEYRRFVDQNMADLLAGDDADDQDLRRIVELGLQHEQQHQELILTDIKHVLSCNPLFPAYRAATEPTAERAVAIEWLDFDEGLYRIGHEGDRFAFDNEAPCHRVFLESFQLASHPVTNGEYREFIDDGGYRRPELWLSLGWQTVCDHHWQAPLYWTARDDGWRQFTLAGLSDLQDDEPVCHVSYFEADAYARWAGARLPTEAEWEVAAADLPIEGNFVDTLWSSEAAIQPGALTTEGQPLQRMFGDVWEWTASPYTPYPRYQAPAGALGEYNGKFMCNQYVLRGGSCATSRSHIRRTYRNFFPPEARWQFSGLRLAR